MNASESKGAMFSVCIAVVRAQRSVVGWSRSKDLNRLTILDAANSWSILSGCNKKWIIVNNFLYRKNGLKFS